jgi:hypothetical protein
VEKIRIRVQPLSILFPSAVMYSCLLDQVAGGRGFTQVLQSYIFISFIY